MTTVLAVLEYADALECRRCGEPVRADGSPDVPVQLRKAVHAESGSETCAGTGCLVAPIGAGVLSP